MPSAGDRSMGEVRANTTMASASSAPDVHGFMPIRHPSAPCAARVRITLATSVPPLGSDGRRRSRRPGRSGVDEVLGTTPSPDTSPTPT